MGNEAAKTWVFEHVLFLDPNAPPFVSQEEYARRRRAQEGGEEAAEEAKLGHRRTVKRTAPQEIRLRTRKFPVRLDIAGRTADFDLECINDPVAMILKDRHGRELRRLSPLYIREMVRHQTTIRTVFQPPGGGTSQADTILLTFVFPDMNETQVFIDTVRLMYGVFVAEYGVTRPGLPPAVPETRAAEYKPRCPIHGDVPCRCATGRVPSPAAVIEPGAEEEAAEFPVTITGKLETGAILRWADTSAKAKAYPAQVVEWRISQVPGREPEFPFGDQETPATVIVDNQLSVRDDMVTKMVQVKVVRRIRDPTQRRPTVESTATRGPVTVDDREARRILEIVTTPSFECPVELTLEHAIVAFPTQRDYIEDLGARAPFIRATLIVHREGVGISLVDIETAAFQLMWPHFYATRLTSEQSALGPEEDLYLQLHFRRTSKREFVLRVATPSLWERNAMYHAIYFFKLQKSFKHFDRWARDLQAGNFAVFKERYAKLWGTTSFYEDVVDALEIAGAMSPEASIGMEAPV